MIASNLSCLMLECETMSETCVVVKVLGESSKSRCRANRGKVLGQTEQDPVPGEPRVVCQASRARAGSGRSADKVPCVANIEKRTELIRRPKESRCNSGVSASIPPLGNSMCAFMKMHRDSKKPSAALRLPCIVVVTGPGASD